METDQTQANFPATGVPENLASASLPSQVPAGAKAIAVLFYVLSIPYVIFGILSVFGLSFIASVVGSLGFGSGFFWPSVAMIVWGMLSFSAGKGLWSGRQWGRVLAVTMSGLYIIFGVIDLVKFGGLGISYVSLVINVIVILYLLLSKKIIAAFQSGGTVSTFVISIILAAVVYSLINYPTLAVSQPQALSQSNNSVANNTAASSTSIAITENSAASSSATTNTSSNPTAISSSGTQTYTDPTYGFQLVVPQTYVPHQENMYGRYDVSFFQPPNSYNTETYNDNAAFSVYVNSAVHTSLAGYEQDPNYEPTSMGSTTATESPIQISGQPALEVVSNYPVHQIQDWLLYKGNFYQIVEQKNVTDNQFEGFVASFQLKS